MKQLLKFFVLLAWLPFAASASDEFESDDYLSFEDEPVVETGDHLEGFNRAIFSFNQGFDMILLDPIASGYNELPVFARNRVTNFTDNIEAPAVFVSSLLQGDAQNTFVTFWRFIFNTTLGVGGLFDMATELGVPPRNEEDFGQTLGTWGVGQGSYMMLPFFGPSSLRDAPSRVVDILVNPFSYGLKLEESLPILAADVIDARARLDGYIDQVNETSLDPYATYRSLYLQRRKAAVLNQ